MQLIFQKRARGIYSRLICWWTGGEHYHVGMLFDGHVVIESNSEQGVVTFTLGQKLDLSRWDVIDMPLTEDQTEAVKSFLFREIDCRYDWAGLIMAQIFGFSRESKTKWFCSELAVATLQQAGLLQGARPCNWSPNRLYKWVTSYRLSPVT